MEQESLKQFCIRWLAAWTGNRPEELLAFYTPDAYYQDPAFPAGLRGETALRGYFTKLLARNPDWKWKLEQIFPVMEGFVLKWEATIPAGGKVIACRGMDLVLLRERKIMHNEVYFDPRPMLGA